LFVKLRRLIPADTDRVVVNTALKPWHRAMVEGLMVVPLS
jgi:hypothetical protein